MEEKRFVLKFAWICRRRNLSCAQFEIPVIDLVLDKHKAWKWATIHSRLDVDFRFRSGMTWNFITRMFVHLSIKTVLLFSNYFFFFEKKTEWFSFFCIRTFHNILSRVTLAEKSNSKQLTAAIEDKRKQQKQSTIKVISWTTWFRERTLA